MWRIVTLLLVAVSNYGDCSPANRIQGGGLPHSGVDTAQCSVCNLLVHALRDMLQQNTTDEELIAFGISTCKVLHAENAHVCDTLVPALLPEVLFMVERVVATPPEICGSFLKDCGTTKDIVNVMWPLNIPANKPAVKPWPVPEKGSPTLRVLHLSDIHIDRSYVEGSEAQCDNFVEDHVSIFGMFVMCCRNYPPSSEAQDEPVKVPAGKWGTSAKCDLPYRTFVSAMSHISKTEELDYIMITGDLEAHDIGDYTREKTQANIANITATLRQFFPTTPIYQAVGNHEGVPSDAFMPHAMDEYDKHGPQWLYNALARIWSPEINAEATYQTQYRGSYAQQIYPGLKLISINSIYCSHDNFYIYVNQVDPDNTLQWLIDQLLDSEAKNEKVHLFAHIPSGGDYCLKGWSFNMYDIVNRFEGTIAAQFYGHTHLDHFQLFYEDANSASRATHINYITPSLTTNAFLNPAFRVYTIDGNYTGSSYTVLDIEGYYANITDANANDHEPEWQRLYKATEYFGLRDLSPASWNELTARLLDDPALFAKWYRAYTRNSPEPDCAKSASCRKGAVCSMRTGRSHDPGQFC